MMKKLTNRLTFALMVLLAFKGKAQVPTVIVQDSIYQNTHWTCDKQYLLKGYVYVVAGTTITIDSGVIIRGDKNTKGSLIIERGAKIYAIGGKYNPIVFTSNQPMGNRTYGDWGGLILCGYAPANWNGGVGQVEGGPRSLYGGNNKHDNSGRLSYVRCEFAGIAFSPNNEINGITFCGVGDATQVDHCQVSYSGDDSYEWFGGTVNTKYLIAYRGWDDDFDTDNSYSGLNQFGVGLRDPFAADQSGSKGFESDSYQAGTKSGLAGDTSGLTKCVFSNYTIIGGLVQPTSTSYDPQFVSAAHIRRGSAISIMNSVLIGYPCGVLIDESSASYGSTVRNLQQLGSPGDTICQLRNNIIAGIPTTNTPNRKEIEYVFDGARSLTPTNTEGDTITGTPFNPFPGPFDFYYSANAGTVTVKASRNKIYPTEQTGVRLQSPFNLNVPNFIPTSTSPICYNSTALPAYVKTHYSVCCQQADHFGNGNLYPFNPTMPLNPDTSNWFANYNMPSAWPAYSSGRLQSNFFNKVNYVGAFAGTQTTSDNWMAIWTNFDPVNTDYSAVCSYAGIKSNFREKTFLQVYPNPTRDIVNVSFTLENSANASIELYDYVGKKIESVNLANATPGMNETSINTNHLPAGIYFVKLNVNGQNKSVKLVVTK
jgi:hypothetical protein